MKLSLYCICGASWSGTVSAQAAPLIAWEFNLAHSGEGHAPCDAATAKHKRRKAERKAENARLGEMKRMKNS